MPLIQIFKGAIPQPQPESKSPNIGKTAFFRVSSNGTTIAGVLRDVKGSMGVIALAVPNGDGVLVVSKNATLEVPLDSLKFAEASCIEGCDVREWESNQPVENTKSVAVKDGDGNVVDYKDVTFDGYGSTFQGTTPEDRDGDYILENAFDATMKEFKANPVMLTDHTRKVANLMGSYSKIGKTARGLALTGNITNSPHPDAKHVRALVAEGHLKTLSIGGMFFYLDDWKGIQEIRLYEVSLVTVPANPDATFSVRTINADTAEKAFAFHSKLHGGEVRSKIKF